MNMMIKIMLENQAKKDCMEKGGTDDASQHGFTTAVNYIESFELLVLELSMAADTDDKEEVKRCQDELVTLCTVNNYCRC